MTELTTKPGRQLRSIGQQTVPMVLGIIFGLVMPLVSALLFRTYTDSMPTPALERARLLELQFVACEIAVIAFSVTPGKSVIDIWQRMPRDIRLASLLLIIVIAIGCSCFATQPADAMFQSLIQLIHIRFALAVYSLAKGRETASWDQFGWWLAAGMPLFAASTIYWFAIAPSEWSVPGGRIVWDQAIPGWISVRYLGTWLAAIACFFTVKQLYLDRNGQPTVSHAVQTAVLGYLFWTGTRAGIIGLAVAIVGAAVILRRIPDRRAAIYGVSIATIAMVFAIVFASSDPNFWLFNFGDGESMRAFTAGRTELWAATAHQWAKSPLFGWGTGSLVWDVNVGWHHTQPHNAILQFGENWGVLGLAALLWLFVRATRAAAARIRTHPDLLPTFGIAMGLLGMSMLDGALYYPRFIILIMIGYAVVLAASRQAGDQDGLAHAAAPARQPAPEER